MGDKELDISSMLKEKEDEPPPPNEETSLSGTTPPSPAPLPSPISPSTSPTPPHKEEKRPPRDSFTSKLFMEKAAGTFPFSAIVGQDVLKRSLILNVINPKVGGVLIRGEKGTGKSVAVRSLSDILPKITVNSDCKFNCDPRKPDNFCGTCT
ncbi:MAG: hypothetical protein KAT70_00820, partial [Thermoplasmata archaeon]|nr:hypothetical protein [Thermoplasmata archaeon]